MHTPVMPVGVGHVAADFVLDDADPAVTLSTLRGAPVVLIFTSPEWNPARDDLAAQYAGWYGSVDGVRVVTVTNPRVAGEYGIDGDALFVVDGDGIIKWRHVPGLDALRTPSGQDDWSRRDFVQVALAAASLLALTMIAPARAAAYE